MRRTRLAGTGGPPEVGHVCRKGLMNYNFTIGALTQQKNIPAN